MTACKDCMREKFQCLTCFRRSWDAKYDAHTAEYHRRSQQAFDERFKKRDAINAEWEIENAKINAEYDAEFEKLIAERTAAWLALIKMKKSG